MNSNRIRRSVLPIGVAGAIAVAMAASVGFSTGAVAKNTPDKTAAEAQKALVKGDAEKAIGLAEAVVAANPREAGYRALLAQAYLRAGRFDSAVTTFNDAMKLGDNSTKTALSLSLAYIGAGRGQEAVGILNDWRDAIPASDLGLAYALAGETGRGVAILTDALRAGDKSPKLRQNLAYAFALDGRWREARLMAAQDVPADQLDSRLSGWAAQAKPEDSKLRVASLLKAPMRADAGQPAALALSANGDQVQLAAETGAARNPAPGGELPATGENAASLAQYRPVDAPAVAQAEQTPEAFSQQFNSGEVVQPLPAAPDSAPVAKAKPRPVRVAAAVVPAKPKAVAHRPGLRPRHVAARVAGKGSSHAVQLGSFASEQGARRAWGYYAKKNPELRNFKMAISQATVKGKRYWRVAAAGLDGRGAGGLCSAVKNRGGVCFAYSVSTSRNAPAYARAKVKAAPKLAFKPKAAPAPVAKAPAGPANARKK
ncbi:tetratricopeptide repeat protein [Novosphingobium sp.]|uniref:tetratricopeptide repeat protein n=1 Tax=Novosphingobium sp. TaxID=1874826 RepID=UPI0025CCCBA0|nr:tetratricopeptide repeat protein [Novosphingobium sp.]MCC6926428.1 tetratricopeptide repeat protein [Novosphingobium sp.]